MKLKPMVWIAASIAVIAVGYLAFRLTWRGAYESATYSLVTSDGAFEIREYPDIQMATTSMDFDSKGDDGSFMRLFRYISGANAAEQQVAMTTPVFMEREGEHTTGQMGFVIPRAVVESSVPDPTNDGVAIRTRKGGRFAVIRFAGQLDRASSADAESKLRHWIEEQGFAPEGEAELAGYDPPWTPGPFRRNEILIRLTASTTP